MTEFERDLTGKAIVGGFDVHRAQITFDYIDTDSGQVTAGQIRPATTMVEVARLIDDAALVEIEADAVVHPEG